MENLPNEFIAIVDKDGDVQDTSPVNDDVIWALVRRFDKALPGDAPHTPWHWNGTNWKRWR